MNSLTCWIKHRPDRSNPWDRWGRPAPLLWCAKCKKDRIDFGRIALGTVKTILGAIFLVGILTIGIWCK